MEGCCLERWLLFCQDGKQSYIAEQVQTTQSLNVLLKTRLIRNSDCRDDLWSFAAPTYCPNPRSSER